MRSNDKICSSSLANQIVLLKRSNEREERSEAERTCERALLKLKTNHIILLVLGVPQCFRNIVPENISYTYVLSKTFYLKMT